MQVVDEMPVLLPGENRMTFDTFMHRNRGTQHDLYKQYGSIRAVNFIASFF